MVFKYLMGIIMQTMRYATFCLILATGMSAGAQANEKLSALIEKAAGGQVTSLLFYSQQERDTAFKHIDALAPTRAIEAGGNIYRLPKALQDFSALSYTLEDKDYSFSDYLSMPETKGFLVWQDGKILLEHYGTGHDASTLWVSFSVSKSVTSMLVGAAIQDGYIKSVDEPAVHYVSRLRGTDYDSASIKNVLQMASGLGWSEDYADPKSDVAQAGGANGVQLVNYLAGLKREAPAGEKFNYNTGETNLVGEILRSAIGNNASSYLTHKIWQPFGMESDATWLLGSPGGGETGGCCINATLRDYARIGIFALGNGKLADGTQVLPKDWIKESTSPSRGFSGYGYLWWLDESGSYRARGIFGQQIFIDPASNLVITVHSNAPTAVGSVYHAHLEQVVAAFAQALAD
jgi:CubicO group peptidase (beta-lactamase class C family)